MFTSNLGEVQCAQGWKKLFLGMSQGGQWLCFFKYLGYLWSCAKEIRSKDISKKIWLHVKVGYSGILYNYEPEIWEFWQIFHKNAELWMKCRSTKSGIPGTKSVILSVVILWKLQFNKQNPLILHPRDKNSGEKR